MSDKLWAKSLLGPYNLAGWDPAGVDNQKESGLADAKEAQDSYFLFLSCFAQERPTASDNEARKFTYLSQSSRYSENSTELGKHQHSLPLRTHQNYPATQSRLVRGRHVYQFNPGALDIWAATDNSWKSDKNQQTSSEVEKVFIQKIQHSAIYFSGFAKSPKFSGSWVRPFNPVASTSLLPHCEMRK